MQINLEKIVEEKKDGEVVEMVEYQAVGERNPSEINRREPEDMIEAAGSQSGMMNKVNEITTAYKEWRLYRQEIKTFPAVVDLNLHEIQDGLSDYRLTLAGLDHKAPHIDEDVWRRYDQILDEIPELKSRTFTRRPLLFRYRSWLYEVWMDWKALIRKQENLLDLLSRAPEALIFYDKMRTIRFQRKVERARRAEVAQEVASARQSLKESLSKINDMSKGVDEVTYGSEILRLEEARNYWNEKLDEIFKVERIDLNNAEQVLSNIYWLGEVVRDAPVMARGVRALEVKFNNLISAHDMLVSFGRSVIPQSEIARTTMMVYKEVPQLWATGDFDELDRVLQSLENFVSYYDTKIETELAIAERKRPGLTRALALDTPAEKDLFPQLLSFARSMVNAVDARDRFMRGHSESVTRIALKIARKMDWKESDLEQLELAGLLHDVGKLSIPENILTKAGPLTPHEWSVIQMHPYYSAQIIKPVKAFSGVVPWVYHHQERWDGKGYPDGLAKSDIPAGASVIALSEAYTVMTSGMPHRDAVSKEVAIEKIKEEEGEHFNPEVVEAFVDLMKEDG
jgi:HD-GYP domain-containing protein (c-di-GMP phosphodiesterase class II)